MDEINYICPYPKKWHEIHQILLNYWTKNSGDINNRPPIPLILAGWNFSEDWQKKERWTQTINWTKRMGCEHLMPILDQEDKYKG